MMNVSVNTGTIFELAAEAFRCPDASFYCIFLLSFVLNSEKTEISQGDSLFLS